MSFDLSYADGTIEIVGNGDGTPTVFALNLTDGSAFSSGPEQLGDIGTPEPVSVINVSIPFEGTNSRNTLILSSQDRTAEVTLTGEGDGLGGMNLYITPGITVTAPASVLETADNVSSVFGSLVVSSPVFDLGNLNPTPVNTTGRFELLSAETMTSASADIYLPSIAALDVSVLSVASDLNISRVEAITNTHSASGTTIIEIGQDGSRARLAGTDALDLSTVTAISGGSGENRLNWTGNLDLSGLSLSSIEAIDFGYDDLVGQPATLTIPLNGLSGVTSITGSRRNTDTLSSGGDLDLSGVALGDVEGIEFGTSGADATLTLDASDIASVASIQGGAGENQLVTRDSLDLSGVSVTGISAFTVGDAGGSAVLNLSGVDLSAVTAIQGTDGSADTVIIDEPADFTGIVFAGIESLDASGAALTLTAQQAQGLSSVAGGAGLTIIGSASEMAAVDPAVLGAAANLTVTTPATAAEAASIFAGANSDTGVETALSISIEDTPDSVLALPAGLLEATSALTIDGAASPAEAAAILSANPSVSLDITGTASEFGDVLTADGTALDGSGGAVTVSDPASIVQATLILGIAGATGTSFDIAADADSVLAADTAILSAAGRVIITDTANVAQAVDILQLGASVQMDIAGDAAAYETVLDNDATALDGSNGLIAVTNGITVALANRLSGIDGAAGFVFDLTDTASAILTADAGLLSTAASITATEALTPSDAAGILAINGNARLDIVGDIAAFDTILRSNPAALDSAGSTLAVVGDATTAQALLLVAVEGTTGLDFDLRDTVANLLADTALLSFAANVVASGVATPAEAASILASNPSVTIDITGSAEAFDAVLAADASALDGSSGLLVVTSGASTTQASRLAAVQGAVGLSVSITDSVAAVEAASAALLSTADLVTAVVQSAGTDLRDFDLDVSNVNQIDLAGQSDVSLADLHLNSSNFTLIDSIGGATTIIDGGPGSVIGTAFSDQIFAADTSDNITAGAGDDRLIMAALPSAGGVFDGGSGTDVLDFSATDGPVEVDLAAGLAQASAPISILNFEAVIGSAFSDTVLGSSAADTIAGGEGADSLIGGAGDDSLSPGAGIDTVDGGAGADTVYGSAADLSGDFLTLSLTDSIVIQSSGEITDISLSGSTLSFTDDGVLSSVTVNGLGSSVVLNRSVDTAGNTVITFDQFIASPPAPRPPAPAQGSNTVTGSPVLASFDDLIEGSAAGDFLRGGRGADTIFGNGGNDGIFAGVDDDDDDYYLGGPGDDILGGGAGNDTLIGDGFDGTDLGSNTLFGGEGDDVIVVGNFLDDNGDQQFEPGEADTNSGDQANTAFGGPGHDSIYGGGGNDTLGGGHDNDMIEAGGGNDQTYGGLNDDMIDLGSGDDSTYAGAGDDTVLGGGGSDVLFTGAGADSVSAGAGDDTIYAGRGDDRFEGGAGADVFFLIGDGGDDTVLDFAADEDRFDLTEISGVAEVDDLTINDAVNADGEAGALLDLGGASVFLLGVSADDLSADNFIFAGV